MKSAILNFEDGGEVKISLIQEDTRVLLEAKSYSMAKPVKILAFNDDGFVAAFDELPKALGFKLDVQRRLNII